MKDTNRFAAFSATLVGVLSIAYTIFYLVISRPAPFIGTLGAWIILAASGFFSSAVYVALYVRLKEREEFTALWAMVLGVGASFATILHGGYQALLLAHFNPAIGTPNNTLTNLQALPSQSDPGGLATFLLAGIVTLILSSLILRRGIFSRNLGFLGIVNGCLLVILYLATVGGVQALILISGGLTSVILGPIWWIWIGSELRGERAVRPEKVFTTHSDTAL
jgi:hypothetical protein